MPQSLSVKSSGNSAFTKRKNAPVKQKRNFRRDQKGTKALNKALEQKAAAKAIKNESKFTFSSGDLNERGHKQVKEDQAQREKKQAKKRSSQARQNPVEEAPVKRSKLDLE